MRETDVTWIKEETDIKSTLGEAEVEREEVQAERDTHDQTDKGSGVGVVVNITGRTTTPESRDMASGRNEREMIGEDIGEIILVLTMSIKAGTDTEVERKNIDRETEVAMDMVGGAE